MDGETHLGVDATADDEVACLGEFEDTALARILVPAVEREPIGFDEGVVHGGIITVDQGQRVASVQEQVAWLVVPAFLEHHPGHARQRRESGLHRATGKNERKCSYRSEMAGGVAGAHGRGPGHDQGATLNRANSSSWSRQAVLGATPFDV